MPPTGGHPQQPGYPPYGYPPHPPKKSNTAVIVSIVVVVLVLGTLGITGFVAPGFFLSDDESSGDGSSTASPAGAVDSIVAALNSKDASALESIKCSQASKGVSNTISRVSEIDSAQLNGEVRTIGDTQAEAKITVVFRQRPVDGFFLVIKNSDTWCWSDVGSQSHAGSVGDGAPQAPQVPAPPEGAPQIPAPPGGAPQPPARLPGPPESVAKTFVSKVNSNDLAGATQMACREPETLRQAIDLLVSRAGTVTIEDYHTDPGFLGVVLHGNDGIKAGYLTLNSDDETTWCVSKLEVDGE